MGNFCLKKQVKFELFFLPGLLFFTGIAMQNNFCDFEELVLFNLWIPDSGFRILVSGFRFLILDSGFRFPGFRVALDFMVTLGGM